MTSSAHELGATLGQWNSMIRRARMTDRQKLVALLISSYANSNGTGIHCGVARLATDLGASYSTSRRYLAWLRRIGLIELVRAGSSRARRSDEYRLILGPDVMEHLEVLDPARYKELSDGMRQANREGQKARRVTADERSSKVSAQTPPDAEDERSTRVSAHPVMSAQMTPDERSPMGEPPPVSHTFPRRSTFQPADEDLRTDVAVDGAPEETTKPEPSPRPQKCPDGLSAATRPDGKPECPICRRRESRPGIEIPPPLEQRMATVTDLNTWRTA